MPYFNKWIYVNVYGLCCSLPWKEECPKVLRLPILGTQFVDPGYDPAQDVMAGLPDSLGCLQDPTRGLAVSRIDWLPESVFYINRPSVETLN